MSVPTPDRFQLAPEELRLACRLDELPCGCSDDVTPLGEIVGQDRALAAIRLGLAIDQSDYNVFITGLAGTGRNTTIKKLLAREGTARRGIPPDILYVHNFRDLDQPRVLMLPAGQGRRLQKDMADLVTTLRHSIPAALQSEDLQRRARTLLERAKARRREAVKGFEGLV